MEGGLDECMTALAPSCRSGFSAVTIYRGWKDSLPRFDTMIPSPVVVANLTKSIAVAAALHYFVTSLQSKDSAAIFTFMKVSHGAGAESRRLASGLAFDWATGWTESSVSQIFLSSVLQAKIHLASRLQLHPRILQPICPSILQRKQVSRKRCSGP